MLKYWNFLLDENSILQPILGISYLGKKGFLDKHSSQFLEEEYHFVTYVNLYSIPTLLFVLCNGKKISKI